MTAKEIKIACEKQLPVIFHKPNEKEILCNYIVEIVFKPLSSGRWQCSAILPDPNSSSLIRAWCGHVSLPDGVTMPEDEEGAA